MGFSIDRRVLRVNNLLQISYVNPGGPGEKATLKKGDIIISINNELSSYPLLFKEFARSKPGTTIKFKVLRESKELDLELFTSSMP